MTGPLSDLHTMRANLGRMRGMLVGALAVLIVTITFPLGTVITAPEASAACHQGVVAPEPDGTYTVCPDGVDWVHVNRSVCADYPGLFPQQCSSNSSAGGSNGSTIPGEGTFLVGVDITPGTYRSAPSRDLPCQWWTQSELGNDESQTGFDSSNGQTYATIRPSDASFHTQFCQTWIKIK